MRSVKRVLSALVTLAPAIAFADEVPPAEPQPSATPDQTAPPTPTAQLPPPESTHQEQPPVPKPAAPTVNTDVVHQAGVGSSTGFARAGVLELGGAGGLTLAQNIRAVNFSPYIGWFIVDNFELSAILDVTNLKAGGDDATLFSAMIEPSFHVPLNRAIFGFVGIGVGAGYVSQLGAGAAVQPRIGMDFLIGRSGILRPSLAYEYTTHDAMKAVGPDGTTNVTLVAISSALRFNIGYSSMW
jgi:hypothetical protein